MPRRPGCGLASPQPLRPHTPPPATGGRDPRRGPSAFARGRAAVSPPWLARPVPAGSGVIGHPRHRRIESPPPKQPSSPFGWGERSARRVGRQSLRRPRGPQRADPGRGVGDAVVCGHRGAPPRDALLGRGRRSLGARRAGASKHRAAAHPPGKTKDSRSEIEENHRARPAGQEKSHAVKNEIRAAHPPGETKTSRSEKEDSHGLSVNGGAATTTAASRRGRDPPCRKI